MSDNKPWFEPENPENIPSPALLVYPERVRRNIEQMIKISGDVKRLRPHVKTHKMPELVALQVSMGIRKFKCATIAEAEMTAKSGGEDILLAYQPVGPQIERLFTLKELFPEKVFSTLLDNPLTLERIRKTAEKRRSTLNIYIDIDNGMHRTGTSEPGVAARLIREIHASGNLNFAGLHVYDGHIHEPDPTLREKECIRDFKPVLELIRQLASERIEVPSLVAGGTPTFPVHAQFPGRDLSPGTPVLWDAGYSSRYADLEFLHAAVLLVRVVSKTREECITLDLGYKAVSADKPHPRVLFMGIGDYQVEGQSEEHLVIRTPEAGKMKVGDVLYGIPVHICPTAALYDEVSVIVNNESVDLWRVAARARKLRV
jgi:D-serine deaminase-like pyridoxal phosphate-dependent protein